MKIYHYTTIETLALILKNRTIRFNRLDKVDDMEEAMYGSGDSNIMLGQYCFVSCWTKDDKENLALWKMYTNYKDTVLISNKKELRKINYRHFVFFICFQPDGGFSPPGPSVFSGIDY